jgi:hypothetical protein
MTAQSSIPLKWYVPFANSDASRVEIPVTTSDATRASQQLGFPPLTMQPPESGGVPPQGEDFNGAMNQVARVAWWVLNGGGWPFDSTFASNSNINGYPKGATLQAADFQGEWINTADNNQINPDTVGTSWIPGYQYGQTSVVGLTTGTTTLTPLQAAKNFITLAGALTGAVTIILPNWIKSWTITNNTSGAFAVIVKTAAGSGVTIPQNGTPTRVIGDGTNINQQPDNIAAATSSTHAPQAGQVQRSAFNYAGVAGGTANALTATLTPAPASLTDDLIVIVRAASNNTGATTLNLNGLGATAVVGAGHQALQGGELAANGFACFSYSQALASFVLLWATGGAEQVGAAAASQQAVQLGQLQQTYAWFGGFQVISATGTFTVPANVYRLRYREWGGGGGSGGNGAAGQTSGGGGGGEFAEGIISVTPGQNISCTIGAAGGGGAAGGAGGAGGSTSFTAGAITIVAAGGGGGANGAPSGGNGGASGTGGTGTAGRRVAGANGSGGSGSSGAGGMGGSAGGSGGGGGGGGYGIGAGGITPGGGGGGSGAAGSNSGATGGAGQIIFEW